MATVETLQYLGKRVPARTGAELSLPEHLNLTSYHYSSDARDMIFAIFSILPPREMSHELLQPDYSLSLSEVNTRAAEYILEVRQNLDILSVCQTIPDNYQHPINDEKDTRHKDDRQRKSKRKQGHLFHLGFQSGIETPDCHWGQGYSLQIKPRFSMQAVPNLISKWVRERNCAC